MKAFLTVAALMLAVGCAETPDPTAPSAEACAAQPQLEAAWPFDRLRQVWLDDVDGGMMVSFEFERSSAGQSGVSIRPAVAPFVERTWGEQVVPGGDRLHEIVFTGLLSKGGDRIQSDVGLVRELLEVDPGPAAQGDVSWVLGVEDNTCITVVSDQDAARLRLLVAPTS